MKSDAIWTMEEQNRAHDQHKQTLDMFASTILGVSCEIPIPQKISHLFQLFPY